MRTDCRHYESRTYASGEAVRKCLLDLAPEEPWDCPADCPRYERRALAAILVAVGLWSASSLFVRAGHSDALVFTTWRLWLALPPLAAIVAWRSRRSDSAPFWPHDVSALRWIALLVGAGAFFV